MISIGTVASDDVAAPSSLILTNEPPANPSGFAGSLLKAPTRIEVLAKTLKH